MFTRTRLAAATLLLACGFGMALLPSGNAATPVAAAREIAPAEVVALADEKPAIPVELQYVPHDAALFVHFDAAKLWGGTIGKSIRQSNPKLVEDLAAVSKKSFGTSVDAIKSASVFVPTMKNEPAFGIVFVFNEPFNKDALMKSELVTKAPPNTQTTLITPSDTVAVLLIGLAENKYGKPQTGEGPLSAAIKEAATGKHVMSVGSTFANLPEALLKQMVPDSMKALLESETISGFLSLDKELTLDVRAKSGNAAATAKAFDAFVLTAAAFLGKNVETADKNATTKETLKVLEAVHKSLETAKSTTSGETAKVVVSIPGNLPFAPAFIESVFKVRVAAARSQSSNNLKQIALAMHNYHDTTGTFPPAAVCDKNGKPMLSWRVLILPYIEQEVLYKKFKLDEPWDSENNKKLIEGMPRVYSNPQNAMAKANETNYRVFVGKGAAFDFLKGSKLTDITDGTSNTILVATAKDSVPWTKPDELEFDPEKDMTKLLGFLDDQVCIVAFADGSVRALSKTIEKKALHNAITKAGGEVFEMKEE